ncbi:phosphoenolpyruvate--protein phosphotransferase [Desulforegula conservatrix]|uniref:phosphoenolpyruvate--protein phosphotransferase n=1 Tax=Desulforegula conservatrix TaxID=153026 RepID=UPI0003F91F2B|nr:phosphoenolpyruvate--protein phosphotransferase [Desulforegula conservatrix]
MPNSVPEIRLAGFSGSPGVCIGQAYIIEKKGLDVIEKYHIQPEARYKEVNRLKKAVRKAKEELQHLIASTSTQVRDHVYILEAHMAMFKDKMLYTQAITAIEKEGLNAEWAVKKVSESVKSIFREIPDPYLRERADDITHVSELILHNLVCAEPVKISSIDKRVILVARDLSPAETLQIQLDKVKGFVTDGGGRASHASIIAKSLQIPSVLGCGDAMRLIQSDDIIIVDGINGLVIIHPSDRTLETYERLRSRYEKHKASVNRNAHLPAATNDHVTIRTKANIERPEEIVQVRDYGGDGIGLFRTEFMYIEGAGFPSECELFERYREIAEFMSPNPVTFRTLDINGDKIVPGANIQPEENPALGLRGIRFCLKRQNYFMDQIKAILRASAYGDIRILFPMISSMEEVLESKKLLAEAKDSLAKEGAKFNPDMPVGIMIEVPSAVILADELAKEVDFFSIGTNDLIQYALAIDRGNPQVAYLYDAMHPAILRMLKMVVDVCKKHNIEVCMCGEMAGEIQNLPLVLGLGMDELSINPPFIPEIKNIIRAVSQKETRAFVEEALKLTTSEQVYDLVQERYGHLFRLENA